MTLRWTTAAVVAALVISLLCYRWGYRAGAEAMGRMEFARGLRCGWNSRPIFDGPDAPKIVRCGNRELLRATPEEIDACFGPRGVVPR